MAAAGSFRQALLVVDVQASFEPPDQLCRDIQLLASTLYSVATVERHSEDIVPFERQLGWKPAAHDLSLVRTDRLFIKHGYLPPPALLSHLVCLKLDRVLVCGLQADTCVLAAGFALFDAGLRPSLLPWLTRGSSLDRSGQLGEQLWRHHFGAVLNSAAAI